MLGGATAILALLPRVTVEPGAPFEPSNPFSAPFTIANTNFVPLEGVGVSVRFCDITFEPPEPPGPGTIKLRGTEDGKCNGTVGARGTITEWNHHRLGADEKYTISIGDWFNVTKGNRIISADISIVVSFYPWIAPFQRERHFRFITKAEADGLLHWSARPVDSP